PGDGVPELSNQVHEELEQDDEYGSAQHAAAESAARRQPEREAAQGEQEGGDVEQRGQENHRTDYRRIWAALLHADGPASKQVAGPQTQAQNWNRDEIHA